MELQDEAEHARLVLMLAEGSKTSVKAFAAEMRLEYPDMRLERLADLYKAYCGMDGRQLPYLSIETGERLSKHA
jgi:hypothetical protein